MRNFLVIILLFISSLAFAQEAALQFEQANQLYRSGEYQKAAQMLEQIIKNGYASPALYYNLGNVYFKQNNIPASILNYERAKRLSPNDDDINYNLQLANLRVIDKIEPIPRLFIINWWKSFIDLFSSGGWSWAAIIFLWITAICGALIFVLRGITFQRLAFVGTITALIITVLSFIGMFQRYQSEQKEQWAVVFSQTVSVKSAPDVQSTDLFVLHEGVKVEFLDAVGEWRKIRLADGKVGWLMVEAVRVI
ncbi:MAG: tetratricopeptide repeat protein [Ignavibacteriales bacterium]|nr:tetratricopeptide repeat protein [Ignavibacteriales bacterium]